MTCFVATADTVFAKELRALAVMNGMTTTTGSADILLLDIDQPIESPPCRKIVRFSRRADAKADFMRPFRYDMLLDFWQLPGEDGEEEDLMYGVLPVPRTFTATERRLLEVLLEANGDVVTAADLAQRVFDDPACLNELKVYVRHLRQKIEEPLGIRVIETVRGVGYRFRTDRLSGKQLSIWLKR